MNIKLVAICGKKRSGKDTVAEYLINNHGFKRYAFADPIKRGAMEMFGFTEAQMWGSTEEKETVDERWNISPRKMLQLMGTELFQFDIHNHLKEGEFNVGREVWVRRFMLWFQDESKKHTERGEDFKIVISDVRFPHEVHNIQKLGGEVWKIHRPSISSSDGHSSEMEMDSIIPDIEFMNAGTLEELYNNVEDLLCTRLSQ